MLHCLRVLHRLHPLPELVLSRCCTLAISPLNTHAPDGTDAARQLTSFFSAVFYFFLSSIQGMVWCYRSSQETGWSLFPHLHDRPTENSFAYLSFCCSVFLHLHFAATVVFSPQPLFPQISIINLLTPLECWSVFNFIF